MAGPLDGLLVVDATWGAAGAIGTALLADNGARVVKIERPGSTAKPSAQRRGVWERGKHSIALDPRDPDDAARLRALAVEADVFVESFGAGRAAGYGLAYEQLAGDAPRLIVVSVTGYGSDGPWRDRPGYEALVAARLGAMSEVEGNRDGPKFLGNPAIGYATGFLIAIDALAAVAARHRTGRGQAVDVSLLDGALAQMPMTWWWNERGVSFVARDGATTGFGRSRIITGIFECAGGEHVMVHSGGEGGFKRAMDILGFGDEVATIVDRPEMSVPLDDREYEIARELAPKVFATLPREQWVERFHAADLAVMPVLRPAEVLTDGQVVHAGMTVRVDDPVVGPHLQTRPAIVFASTPAGDPEPAPRPDQHRDTVEALRSGWPVGAPAGGEIDPAAAPLAGIRVLDFSSFFATAYGAKLLCDLGADVIKIEPPAGDQLRPFPDPFEACNRGKRSLAIDMRTPEGAAAIADLVATADVVMHNLRPGKAERAGIGYDQVRERNPSLIYCYLPGFGSSGPRRDDKSFEPLLSGFTGLLYEAAGDGETPVRKAFGNADYYNGMLGATAVLAALARRSIDPAGHGQYVESPHLHSSLFVVSHNVADLDGTPLEPDVALDAGQMGWSPTYRLYQATDGWVCIAAFGDRAFVRLVTALGCPELAVDPRWTTADGRDAHRDDLVAALTLACASRSVDELLAALDAAEVPAERARPDSVMNELFFASWALESGRVYAHEHPQHGAIREVGMVTRLAGTPGVRRGPNALLGRHSREILRALGRDDAEIDGLVARSICVEP